MALDVVAYEILRFQSPVSAAPNTFNTIRLQTNDSVPLGYKWKVTAISTMVISAAGPVETSAVTLYVYDTDPTDGRVVPFNSTIAGVLDTDNDGYMLVDQGCFVYFVFLNVPQGDTCHIRLQYEKIQVTGTSRPVLG